MITHTSDSHQIPSQKKTWDTEKNGCKKLYMWYTFSVKLFDKMYKYEMDPSRTVGTTEQTRDAGQMDGQSETNIPPNNFVVRGYKTKQWLRATR